MPATSILKRQSLVLVLQLDLELLLFSLLVQNPVREEDKDDDFLLWLKSALVDLVAQLERLELVSEHIAATSRGHKEVVSLSGLLRCWVKLGKQIHRLIRDHNIVTGFFRSLA